MKRLDRLRKVYSIELLIPRVATIFTSIRYLFLSVPLVLAMSSCGEHTDNVEAKIDTLATKAEAGVDSLKEDYRKHRDENFVKDVIEKNTKEIHLLELARAKASRKDIKDGAVMMLADHHKMGEQMKDYASKHNITVEIDEDDIKSNLDNDKAGADWDRKWVDMMVNEHEELVRKFNNAANDIDDMDLRSLVTNTIPTLNHHLEMARDIQNKMNK